MDEKTEEQGTTEDVGEGVQQKTTSELDRADEIVERRDRVCEREEKILDRKEAMKAREMVGGTADAGEEPVVKEESPKDYSERVMSGKIE